MGLILLGSFNSGSPFPDRDAPRGLTSAAMGEYVGWTIATAITGAIIVPILVVMTPLGLALLAINASVGFWSLVGACAGAALALVGGLWAAGQERQERR